jgi:hypothetical protein
MVGGAMREASSPLIERDRRPRRYRPCAWPAPVSLSQSEAAFWFWM